MRELTYRKSYGAFGQGGLQGLSLKWNIYFDGVGPMFQHLLKESICHEYGVTALYDSEEAEFTYMMELAEANELLATAEENNRKAQEKGIRHHTEREEEWYRSSAEYFIQSKPRQSGHTWIDWTAYQAEMAWMNQRMASISNPYDTAMQDHIYQKGIHSAVQGAMLGGYAGIPGNKYSFVRDEADDIRMNPPSLHYEKDEYLTKQEKEVKQLLEQKNYEQELNNTLLKLALECTKSDKQIVKYEEGTRNLPKLNGNSVSDGHKVLSRRKHYPQ